MEERWLKEYILEVYEINVIKKKEYGMTCYFAVKNDGAHNLTKEQPVAFSLKENTFFHIKLKLTVGIHISAGQQVIRQF